MTRKRFVKLCMANGYSRNSANRIADAVVADGKTYAEVYKALSAVKKLTAAIVPAVSETVQRIIEVFGKMMNAVSAGAAAFSKAFSAAMTEE